ncbi:hypothetical protein ADK82_15310 [Streptomyces sp. NRRL S-4]|nr:hypothetical protein ADK82_15310 [Streptomyces sp. NRRL S-4]
MLVQYEVSVPSVTLLILMVVFAAVVVPPTMSLVTGWWSVRLRRWGAELRIARMRLAERLRRALRAFLDGDGRG